MSFESIRTTGTNTYASSSDVVENPKGKLDKDAFLKLFLEELKYQDPTAPMDSDKILTQTSQLTQLESSQEMKKSMEAITKSMSEQTAANSEWIKSQTEMKDALEAITVALGASSDHSIFNKYNAVGMIGKMVESDISGVNVSSNEPVYFELYFDEEIDTSKPGSVEIRDEDGFLVQTIPLDELHGKKGLIGFNWDTKRADGEHVPTNKSYNITANYNIDEAANEAYTTRLGRGKVESVLYNNGEPMLKIGSLIIPLDSAMEFY